MSNTWMNKLSSSKQEHLVSKVLGWKVVLGSGSRSNHPGDVESEDWLGECKTHSSTGHKIVFRSSVWKKICEEADSKFKFPALFVDDGSQTIKHTWVMFRNLPFGEYHLVDFPYTVKKDVSFDSLNMLELRISIRETLAVPVVYSVGDSSNIRLISSLEDFVALFNSLHAG